MGLLDGPLRAAAATLMGQFGTSAMLRTTGATYDPATRRGSVAPADVPVKGVLEAYPDLQSLGGARATDQGVQQGDMKFTLAALGIAELKPTTHQLVIAGVVWKIVKVDVQMATDQAALYVLQIRR